LAHPVLMPIPPFCQNAQSTQGFMECVNLLFFYISKFVIGCMCSGTTTLLISKAFETLNA